MATTAYLPAGLPPMDTGVAQPGQSTAYMSAGVPGIEAVTAGGAKLVDGFLIDNYLIDGSLVQ